MIHLADFCYRRRWLVLGLWVVTLVAVIVAGAARPPVHHANYQTPGAEATKAYELLGQRFPSVVIGRPNGYRPGVRLDLIPSTSQPNIANKATLGWCAL